MALVVESTASNTASGTAVTITKPTGLSVGDLMIAPISSVSNVTTTDIATPSGWTSLANTAGTNGAIRIFSKIADSSDVAASNFTFTESTPASVVIAGSILRVSGHRPTGFAGPVDADFNNTGSSATISFTSSTTPANDDSLVVMILFGIKTNNGVGTIGSYTTTPSLTFTEVYDTSTNVGDSDPITGIAYAAMGTAAEITAYGATLSLTKTQHLGALVTIYSTLDASGTNALLTVSPTTFTQSGSADTNGTSALLEVSPETFTQNGRATEPTQWSNETKDSTSWNNEQI